MRANVVLAVLAGFGAALAQSSGTSTSSSLSSSSSSSPFISLSQTTSSVIITSSIQTNGRTSTFTTAVPTTFNITYTPTPTSSSTSSSAAASASASASASATPITLDTKLDPAFGVLGAVLIITGLPSAFWGHKNRWTSFFLIGFYTLSLVCFVLILKFGILAAVNPPNKTLRGMFVLASTIAGIAGGGISIFFWKATRYCIGGWGGFAFALWIQCFRNGGLIRPVGFRWILYIGCAVVGFIICTIPKIHYHVLLISTAVVGSSAFMLGVDCFTTAGLKEFYVWNLGFRSLFPKFTNNGIEFPVSQIMQIELGIIGAITLMGAAVQLRILRVLQRKLKEIQVIEKHRDEESEAQASSKFAAITREREEWEKLHPGQHGRNESNYSSMPLMKDHEGSVSPSTPEHRGSDFTHVGGRPRYQSGVSDFNAAPIPDEELKRASSRGLQNPGVLPALDLGLGIEDDVPKNYMAADTSNRIPQGTNPYNQRDELVTEIQTLRKSLDALRTETPISSSSGSRRPSMTSRRTLSIDANTALLPTREHLRPPREADPRARARSMEMSALADSTLGDSISRPTSAPLRDSVNWDAYVQERRLFQPPSGVSAPIATSSITPPAASRIHMPAAVTDALNKRKRRESNLGVSGSGDPGTDSSSDIPLSKMAGRRKSTGGNIPTTILPPKKTSPAIVAPTPQHPVTRTFEELNERHREKMRDIQAPVTAEQRERAEVEAAKQRWERAKASEKEAVTKRQAEKVAMLNKRRQSHDEPPNDDRRRHSRTLSGDKLAGMGTSSKRLSVMKVEDWQKYNENVDEREGRPREHSRQESKGVNSSGVPFPGGRRRSRGPAL